MVGLKLFLYRARNRLFSRRAWVVLYRPLEPDTETGIPDGIEVREASASDIEGIAEALPDELAGRLSREKRIVTVSERFRARAPCILAIESNSGQIVGGCWCRKVTRGSILWPLLPNRGVVFEISTLFVDPDYRGKRLGSVLVEYACSKMEGSGFNGCVSLVWYTRPASVKAHLKVGFKPVGEKVTLSLLGIRRARVHPVFRQERLPSISKVSS